MQLKRNAASIAERELSLDNVVAPKKQLQVLATKKFETMFASTAQIYITKLGLILSHCYEHAELRANTYLGSIDFICNKVLKDKTLYNVFYHFGLNTQGNAVKHSIENVDISIETTVSQINLLISRIVSSTNIKAFKKALLNTKNNNNSRDVPISYDNKEHKYFMIGDFKAELKISPNYSIDPYEKKIVAKLTLFWPVGKPGYKCDIEATNLINQRLISKKGISIDRDESKISIPLKCNESDLNRRVLKLKVNISIYEEKTEHYVTGFFVKKQHTRTYKSNEVSYSVKEISQFFDPTLGKKIN